MDPRIVRHHTDRKAMTLMLDGERDDVGISLINFRAYVDQRRMVAQDFGNRAVVGRGTSRHGVPCLGRPRARDIWMLRGHEFAPDLRWDDQVPVPYEVEQPIPEISLLGERHQLATFEADSGAGIENPQRGCFALESGQPQRHTASSPRRSFAAGSWVRSRRR